MACSETAPLSPSVANPLMNHESGELAADSAQRASASPPAHAEEGQCAPGAISEPMAVVHLPSDAFAAAGDRGPDWGAGQDTGAKHCACQSTTGFAASLQMLLSDSIAKNMRAAADYVAARAEALPQYLQLGGEPWREYSP